MPDDSALEEYTYLVAGCVGEFWTKICLLEWPNYARLSPEEMLVFGKDFGKGLQLVNILRDYPLDLQAGRSYLPVSNLEEIALNPTSGAPGVGTMAATGVRLPGRSLEIRDRCPALASSVCLCGSSIHRSAHPAFIGRRARNPGRESKCPGTEVRRLMVWAAGMALFRFLEPVAYRTIFRR